MASESKRCPCGNTNPQGQALAFEACCQPLLLGKAIAQTAEQLMRSRYSAYATGDMAYVSKTWDAGTRPSDLAHEAETKWLGLEVKSHTVNGDAAEVTFVARYRVAGKGHRMTERSRFVREQGLWWYVDGTQFA